MKKRFLPIFVSLMMVLTTMPAAAYAGDGGQTAAAMIGETGYSTVQAAVDAAAEGETVKMVADSVENVTVATGSSITLDLNGFVLKGKQDALEPTALTQSNTEGSVITNRGTLTIIDSNSGEQTHRFAVTEDTGLWTLDETNGTKIVTGGAITGGTGKRVVSGEDVYCFGGGIFNAGTLTLQGGSIVGNSVNSNGGGVYNYGSGENCKFTMSGGAILGNTAKYGGGISNADGTITMTGGSISKNTAEKSGGGIYSCHYTENTGKTAAVNICVTAEISGNQASYGGGIYNDGYNGGCELTMTGGSVSGNKASYGGGIYNYKCTIRSTNSTISENTAAYYGGGVDNLGGTITMTGGTLSENKVTGDVEYNGYGGGIYNDGGTVNIENSTIYKNSATSEDGGGGGIYNYHNTDKENTAATVNIDATEIKENTSSYGGGINNDEGEVSIKDSTISKNTATHFGGGIINDGSLILDGTKIIYNTVINTEEGNKWKEDFGGAGIDLWNGSVTVKGAVQITGNTTNGVDDNMFMEFDDHDLYDKDNNPDGYHANTPITITDLADGTKIGVTHLMTPTITTPVAITANGTKDDLKYFTSDESGYSITFIPAVGTEGEEGYTAAHLALTAPEETTTEENAPATTFVDVPADAYYADAVAWAVAKGITSGTDATHFSPDTVTTRAQLVTFLWRACGSPAPNGSTAFSDVDADSYYAQAVAWAAENGYVNGTDKAHFAPDQAVTRAQAVTILARMAGVTDSTEGYAQNFKDVENSAYYSNAVAWASSKGITSGVSADMFAPDDQCSRAQIVTFLYRDLAV